MATNPPDIKPPVAPKPRTLPFLDPAFTWDTFEDFFRDFLNAHPRGLVDVRGESCNVVSAQVYGRRGYAQRGIDILATMSNDEVWAFQCKNVKEWHLSNTRKAIEGCTYKADRKLLLITCNTSPDALDEVAQHPDWELWTGDDISTRFIQYLDRRDAARILYTYFGPDWPREMLGINDVQAFRGAELFFAPYLKKGRNFHHRLSLVGRRDTLAKLDEYIEDKKAKVVQLVGRGGIGKSRILLEWSCNFAARHPDRALRFIRDSINDIPTAIDQSRRPLVLVVDDAHRWEGERLALFAEVAARNDVKLVLSLRPGHVQLMQREMLDAGIDSTELAQKISLKRLSGKQTGELVRRAMGKDAAPAVIDYVREISRDCPLIAILAAHLFKTGELDGQDLRDTADVRARVFDGLLRDAEWLEDKYGSRTVRDVLSVLALFAPVTESLDFLKATALFVGGDLEYNHIADLFEELRDAGLVVNVGGGLRVVPDLLSDHLAYTACYNRDGASKAFIERVTKYYSDVHYPQMLQHVAEAEWRAIRNTDKRESAIQPLWEWFLDSFKSSSFYGRVQHLANWAKFAPYQPERTIELATIGLEVSDAPPHSDQYHWFAKHDTHERVVDSIPKLLESVGNYHPRHVHACLDLLWEIGKSRAVSRDYDKTHPINAMGRIAAYSIEKPDQIQDEVTSWMRVFLATDEWVQAVADPGWVLKALLVPFFKVSIEHRWSEGRTFHWAPMGVNLDNTQKHRDEIRGILAALIERGDTRHRIAALHVIQQALRPVSFGYAGVPEQYRKRWDVDRSQTFELCRLLSDQNNEPVVVEQLRRILRECLQSERGDLLRLSRELYNRIPLTLEVRVIQCLLGRAMSDFYRAAKRNEKKGTAVRWSRQMDIRWQTFVSDTAVQLVSERRTTEGRLRLIDESIAAARPIYGRLPVPGLLLGHLARLYPDKALMLVDEIIENPAERVAPFIAQLLYHSTTNDFPAREDYCRRALRSSAEGLRTGAIDCLSWWRRDGNLSEEMWDLLIETAKSATGRVALALANCVWPYSDHVKQDWNLLAVLGRNPANKDLGIRLVIHAGDLARKLPPPSAQMVEDVLGVSTKVEELRGWEVFGAFGELAKTNPGEVFNVFFTRLATPVEPHSGFIAIPTDISEISFDGLLGDGRALQQVEELERRQLEADVFSADEAELLLAALLQTSATHEDRLCTLVHRASSLDQIERLADLTRFYQGPTMIVKCPKFTAELLEAAKHQGNECYKTVQRVLTSGPLSRGTSNGQPDKDWQAHIDALQDALEGPANGELRSIYQRALEQELRAAEEGRRSFEREEEAFEDA